VIDVHCRYGNLSGTGGLLDTTDPSLAYAQSHHLLHGLFLCWSVSAWVRLYFFFEHVGGTCCVTWRIEVYKDMLVQRGVLK